MKIQISQSKVAEILNILGEVGKPGKVEKPIFNGILFEVDGQSIKVTATNGIESVHTLVNIDGQEVSVEGVGKFVLMKNDFRVLTALKGTIEILIKDNQALVKQGSRKIDFPVLKAEDFPLVLPTTAPLNTFVLPSSLFKYVINEAAYAIATNDLRPILTGLNLKVATNGNEVSLEAVSTDSHRVVHLTTGTIEADYHEVTIPSQSIKVIKALPNDDKALLGCAMYENKLILSYDNRIIIILRILEGNFPQCKALFPTSYAHNFPLDTGKMRDALTLMKLVNNGSASENSTAVKNVVKFNFAGNKLTLSSIGKDGIGSFEEEVELTTSVSTPIEIAFTAEYLMDVFKHIKSETCVMNVNAALQPVTVTEQANGKIFEETHLLLPVRVR